MCSNTSGSMCTCMMVYACIWRCKYVFTNSRLLVWWENYVHATAWSVFVCIWTYMFISGQYKTVWQWIQQHSTVKLYWSGQYVYKSTQRHFLLATKMVYCSFLSGHPSCSQLTKSWPRSWCRTGTNMSTSGMFSSRRSACWKCSVLSCANCLKQEVGSFPDLDHERESALEGDEKGLSHFNQLSSAPPRRCRLESDGGNGNTCTVNVAM